MKMTIKSKTSNCYIIFKESKDDTDMIMDIYFDERIKFETKFTSPKEELINKFSSKSSFSVSKAEFKFKEEPINSNQISESYYLVIGGHRLGVFRYSDIKAFIDIFS